MYILCCLVSTFCRGKTRSVACSLPNCLFVSRNCNSFDSYWRGDHETVLPNSLRTHLYFKSFNHSGVVLGFHFSIHCAVSASKPQFNCRPFTHRGCDSHNILHHGLDPLCEPTKAPFHLLWTPIIVTTFCFCISCHECTWNYSLFLQRPQFGPRNSGTCELAIIFFSTFGFFVCCVVSEDMYFVSFSPQCLQLLSTRLVCQCGKEPRLLISSLQCASSQLLLVAFGPMETR